MLVQQALQKTTPLSLVYKLLRLGCIPWGVRRGSGDSWACCHAIRGLRCVPGDFDVYFCAGGSLETSAHEYCRLCWVCPF